jgi:hypothetical protein
MRRPDGGKRGEGCAGRFAWRVPLECRSIAAFLSFVFADRIRSGLSIGLIGAAATAGALVGLGLRHGGALLPFEMGGRALLADWRLTTGTGGVAISLGVVSHLMWMTLWGVCFSVVATRLRGLALPAGALLFVLCLGALAGTVVPGALGAASFAGLTTAQTAFLLTLLAGAFIAGVVGVRPRP